MLKLDSAINEFQDALLQINRVKAAQVFEKLFSEGEDLNQLELVAIGTLEHIGEGWENGTVSLAQVYMSGVICEELIEKYLPKYDAKRINQPKIAIGVLLDHHALGKRIVYSVLRAAGYDVIDFGQGLSIDEIVRETLENKVGILLISTLMLPSALKVRQVKDMLMEQNSDIKIVVGGAPFRLDSDLWKKVGADVDGKNASTIVKTVENLSNIMQIDQLSKGGK